MKPKMIEIKCPVCKAIQKPIAAQMGDKTIKCSICGKFIRYRFRKKKIENISRPGRQTASGLTF